MLSPLCFSLIAAIAGLAIVFWKYRLSQIRSILARRWRWVAVFVALSLLLNNPKTLILDIGFCLGYRAPSADVSGLEQLLKAQRWKEADVETSWLIRVAAGTERQVFPTLITVYYLPCNDLKTIDQLWVKYSQGKFGYSVQRKLYHQAIAKVGGSRSLIEFLEVTGFDKNTFSLKAPNGHLPSSGRVLSTTLSIVSGSPVSTAAFANRQNWCGL
jgi:hypothetical protein